ncbi:MAG: glycosyl transferase, partial [Ignavibacteria bacterium CG_4_9_14_0_2_um_filter_37_13]
MISIIIPTYNEESVIEKTLQNLKKIDGIAETEIIVVDGRSSDRTVSIAKNYASVISSAKG